MSSQGTLEETVAIQEQPLEASEPQSQEPEQSQAELPQHIRDHYDAIREKEREVRALEGTYLELKEEAGSAKKDFELADKQLRDLICRGADPQKKLPLGDDAQPPAENNEWRTAPLSELGLTLKQNELFAECGVTTIGGMEELRAAIAENKAEWPKGIGPAKVTDIENRIVDWLDKHRDKFGEAAVLAEETSNA